MFIAIIYLSFSQCLFHGCPVCYSRTTVNPKTGDTMEELYMSYIDRKNTIMGANVNYIEKWEHTFDKEVLDDNSLKVFIDSLPYTDPLTPTDAFRGGRTEIFCLYKEATELDKISFLDVNSLYPYCQYMTYPIKHPQILFGEQIMDNNIDKYFGLIKLVILPPHDLYIPALGMLVNDKFVFGLCYTCMLTKQEHKCEHPPKLRVLKGVWVSEEIKLA